VRVKTEAVFFWSCLGAAVAVLLTLAGLLVVIAKAGSPALAHFGLRFFVTSGWNPVREIFGAAAPLQGTLLTSLLALAFAVPVAFGVAFALTELTPAWLERPLGLAIELLAGIPSIIYGMWGLFIVAPLFQTTVEPWLIRVFEPYPSLAPFFSGPPYGIGILTASCLLALMILPYIAASLREVFRTVSPMVKESAYAMGATTWEVMRDVVLPSTRVGAMGGIVLGLGRALGETMAVTFVIGNAHRLSTSILAPGTTISATIANEFNEATGDLYVASLMALGLLLFGITFIVLLLGRFLLRLMREAPV
jgi:phosphate transport system permease protein